jgi:hypothetical protein
MTREVLLLILRSDEPLSRLFCAAMLRQPASAKHDETLKCIDRPRTPIACLARASSSLRRKAVCGPLREPTGLELPRRYISLLDPGD